MKKGVIPAHVMRIQAFLLLKSLESRPDLEPLVNWVERHALLLLQWRMSKYLFLKYDREVGKSSRDNDESGRRNMAVHGCGTAVYY